MVTLIIKGNKVAAKAALDARQIDGYLFREIATDFDQVVTRVQVHGRHMDEVHYWFMQPNTPPYEAGVLLLFTYRDESPVIT